MPVGQQPGDRTAGVGTGVAPEAVQSFTASDTRVDRAPIWSKDLLFGVRESPAPQREPEGMASGIRDSEAQRKRYRAPRDRFQQANCGQNVLRPVIKGIGVCAGLPRRTVRGVVVAVNSLGHSNEAIGIWRASDDRDTTGAGQANSGAAMAKFITAEEFGRAKEDNGRVRRQARGVGEGFSPQVEAKGLDVSGSDLLWRGSA